MKPSEWNELEPFSFLPNKKEPPPGFKKELFSRPLPNLPPNVPLKGEEARAINDILGKLGNKINLKSVPYGYNDLYFDAIYYLPLKIEILKKEAPLTSFLDYAIKRFPKHSLLLQNIKSRVLNQLKPKDNYKYTTFKSNINDVKKVILTKNDLDKLVSLAHKQDWTVYYTQKDDNAFEIDNIMSPIDTPSTIPKMIKQLLKISKDPVLKTILDSYSKAKQSIASWDILISADPDDIKTMGDHGTNSCISEGNNNCSSTNSAVSNFDMVSYAIQNDKRIARIWLRFDGEKWWPEPNVYSSNPNINDAFMEETISYLKANSIYGTPGKYYAKEGTSDFSRTHFEKALNKDLLAQLTQAPDEELGTYELYGETSDIKYLQTILTLKESKAIALSVPAHIEEKMLDVPYYGGTKMVWVHDNEFKLKDKTIVKSVFRMPTSYVPILEDLVKIKKVPISEPMNSLHIEFSKPKPFEPHDANVYSNIIRNILNNSKLVTPDLFSIHTKIDRNLVITIGTRQSIDKIKKALYTLDQYITEGSFSMYTKKLAYLSKRTKYAKFAEMRPSEWNKLEPFSFLQNNKTEPPGYLQDIFTRPMNRSGVVLKGSEVLVLEKMLAKLKIRIYDQMSNGNDSIPSDYITRIFDEISSLPDNTMVYYLPEKIIIKDRHIPLISFLDMLKKRFPNDVTDKIKERFIHQKKPKENYKYTAFKSKLIDNNPKIVLNESDMLKLMDTGVLQDWDVQLNYNEEENTYDIEKVISPIKTESTIPKMVKQLSKHSKHPILKKLLDLYAKAGQNKKDWYILISADPDDIRTMADHGTHSCISHDGWNCSSTNSAVSNFDMVSYAIQNDKRIARIWLRFDGEKYWPEPTVYSSNPNINDAFMEETISYLKANSIYGTPGKYYAKEGSSDFSRTHLEKTIDKTLAEKTNNPSNPDDRAVVDIYGDFSNIKFLQILLNLRTNRFINIITIPAYVESLITVGNIYGGTPYLKIQDDEFTPKESRIIKTRADMPKEFIDILKNYPNVLKVNILPPIKDEYKTYVVEHPLREEDIDNIMYDLENLSEVFDFSISFSDIYYYTDHPGTVAFLDTREINLDKKLLQKLKPKFKEIDIYQR